MALIGVASVIYLLNPTWGVFELIPDNLPFFGNIDEASITLLLLWVLQYFGIDPLKWFKKEEKQKEIKE